MFSKLGVVFMSSMLEKAIVDARALKEVAMKNAENIIIEKYSAEVKNALESLLEQEETMEEGEPAVHEVADEQLPDAFDDDVAENEMIELDLSELKQEVEEAMGDIESQEELATDLDQMGVSAPPSEMSSDAPEDIQENTEEEIDEEIDLSEIDFSEEDLAEMIEAVVVDMKPVKRGWAGTTESEIEENEMMDVARQNDTEVKAEREALKKRMAELEEQIQSVVAKNKQLSENNKNYNEVVEQLQEKLASVNISNAKLLYINKALGSTSLNERQKRNIVEAISKADTAKEAKVIYETLQSSVGSPKKEKLPDSLSEAVSKRSSLIVAARKEQKSDSTPFIERMQKLAGIDKQNN